MLFEGTNALSEQAQSKAPHRQPDARASVILGYCSNDKHQDQSLIEKILVFL